MAYVVPTLNCSASQITAPGHCIGSYILPISYSGLGVDTPSREVLGEQEISVKVKAGYLLKKQPTVFVRQLQGPKCHLRLVFQDPQFLQLQLERPETVRSMCL
mgnify:CR=1 FL=1